MIDTTKLRELAQKAAEISGYINYLPDTLAFCNSANPAAILELLDRLEAAEKEQHRLNECLRLANANAEYFEREMYLLGDKLEDAERDAKRYRLIRSIDQNKLFTVNTNERINRPFPEELDSAIDAAMQEQNK